MELNVTGLDKRLITRRTSVLERIPLTPYFENIETGQQVYARQLVPHTAYVGVNVWLKYRTMRTVNMLDSTSYMFYNAFFNSYIRWTNVDPTTPVYDVVELRVLDRFFGFYIPDHHILITTFGPRSVTHGSLGERGWEAIVDSLVKEFQWTSRALVIPPTPQEDDIEITLGADPEFELVSSEGRVSDAEDIMDSYYLDSQVGRDGAGSQIELRPKPAKTPSEFVRNMRDTFKMFDEEYSRYHLGTIGDVYPLGGHIHAGVGFPFVPRPDMVRALDEFIGKPTIELSGNARHGYKTLGAVREQPHGFEYRTPPVAIFQRPGITRIVMKVFHNLMHKYINTKGFTYNLPPTEDDYINVAGLTQAEYKRFNNFCTTYQAKTADRSFNYATAFWVGKNPPPVDDNTPAENRIFFRDQWEDASIKDEWRELVAYKLRQAENKRIQIRFFGYREERGLVTNIANTMLENTRDSTYDDGSNVCKLRFGLPFKFRNDRKVFDEYKHTVLRGLAHRIAMVGSSSDRDGGY